MKKNSVIGGILLIALGLFFFFRQLDLPYLERISSWQLILIGIGLYFIITSMTDRKRDGAIFPGVILFGLGIHYLGLDLSPNWPHHWAAFTLIVSIAFFAQFLITRNSGSLIPAIVLLGVTLFSTVWHDVWNRIHWPYVWPVVLIIIGIFFLFRRR